MAKIAMSIEDVGILADAYPDKAEWRRVTYDGSHLNVPDDLYPAIGTVDMGAARKSALMAYARHRRWEIETGGITVQGVPVATDDRSKVMIAGARTSADADPEFTTPWDAGEIGIVLDAEQIIAISNAVRDHIAAVFAKFETVRAGINSDEITTKAAIIAAFDA